MMTPIDRYLTRQGLTISVAALLDAPESQRPSALCYLLAPDDRILLLQRRKEPFSGFWTAPGGKLLPDEDPEAAVIREVREETGLQLVAPRLVAITSELGGPDYDWLLFVFRCDRFTGSLVPSDEGELAWVRRSDLAKAAVPDIDRRLWPYVFREPPAPRPVFIRVRYDAAHAVADFEATELW